MPVRVGWIGGTAGGAPPPPPPPPTSPWTQALTWYPPDGSHKPDLTEKKWLNWPASDDIVFNPDQVDREFVINDSRPHRVVMPAGSVNIRRAWSCVTGGGDLVFCHKDPITGAYIRGGFELRMDWRGPRPTSYATPLPAGYPSTRDPSGLRINDGTTAPLGRIVDITGAYIHGEDISDGIIVNAAKTHVQVQRSHLSENFYRSPDHYLGNGTANPGPMGSPAPNRDYGTRTAIVANPYSAVLGWMHSDCIQPWGGFQTLRLADVTMRSAHQGMMLTTTGDHAVQSGKIYMKRCNLISLQYPFAETFYRNPDDASLHGARVLLNNQPGAGHPIYMVDDTVWIESSHGSFYTRANGSSIIPDSNYSNTLYRPVFATDGVSLYCTYSRSTKLTFAGGNGGKTMFNKWGGSWDHVADLPIAADEATSPKIRWVKQGDGVTLIQPVTNVPTPGATGHYAPLSMVGASYAE